MAFERKFKGATEFLRASKRAAGKTAGSSFGSHDGNEGTAALDNAVLAAVMKLDCDLNGVANAVGAPSPLVDQTIDRLSDEGFIERPKKGTPYKLTDAGMRYLKYSQLTKY